MEHYKQNQDSNIVGAPPLHIIFLGLGATSFFIVTSILELTITGIQPLGKLLTSPTIIISSLFTVVAELALHISCINKVRNFSNNPEKAINAASSYSVQYKESL